MSKSTARRSEAGVALLTAMIVVIIVGGMAAAFLTLSFSQSKAISMGSDREVALHVAEAGVEDSINKLTGYSIAWISAGSTTPTSTADYMFLATQTLATDGTPVCTDTGTVNGGTFTALVSNSALAKGTLATVYTGPFAPTAPPNGYVITSAGTVGKMTRTIQVIVAAVDNSNLFKDGLFGDVQVDALGNFFSDGYNSTKGDYATQLSKSTNTFNGVGYVDATGNIGSNGNIITNGSVTVVGNATPGPGGTSGPGGAVFGSTAPAIAPQPLAPVDYTVPSGAVTPTVDKSGNLTLTGPLTGAPTVYHMSDLSGFKGTIQINGQVTIYVDGTIDMNAKSALQIGTVGSTTDTSKLTIYQQSGDITINGQAVAGVPDASRFQLYSQTTGTIKFNGGSTVYAAMYAPAASFTNNGGNDFYGAMVAKSMKLSGTAGFHYDENLAKLSTPVPDFKILSWVEIPNQ